MKKRELTELKYRLFDSANVEWSEPEEKEDKRGYNQKTSESEESSEEPAVRKKLKKDTVTKGPTQWMKDKGITSKKMTGVKYEIDHSKIASVVTEQPVKETSKEPEKKVCTMEAGFYDAKEFFGDGTIITLIL